MNNSDNVLIRHVVHVIRSAQTGGVESHVQLLAREQAHQGLKTTIISLASLNPASAFLVGPWQIYCLRDKMQWSTRTLVTAFDLSRLLGQLEPDIVHLHGARPIFIGGLAARLSRKKGVVVTLHGAYDLMAVDSESRVVPSRRLLAKLVHGSGFMMADRIIVCAAKLVEEVRKVLSFPAISVASVIERKVRVVRHSIDLTPFRDMSAKFASELRSGPLKIGTLSRLDEPMKGIGVLLDAIKKIQSEGLTVSLRIAGDGYSRAFLERRAKELQLADCRFFGYVNDLAAYLCSLDVFVLPSFSEGMPLVNLEAMACGIPVITTDVGGTAEVVHHGINGLVVSPRSVNELVAAIRLFATNETMRTACAENARRIAVAEFGSERMVCETFSVYREALGGS